MTMALRNIDNTVIRCIRIGCWLFCLIGLISADRSPDPRCPGPIAYYDAVKCKPVFEKSEDPCPVRYDCSNLKNLPTDKCIANGHEYAIGEKLKEEDANPCDIGCTCVQGVKGPTFNCAVVDCFQGPATSGCYRKNSPLDCCPGEEVCPENPEDRAICIVNGKEYREGEYFDIPSEPDKSCTCQPNYKGENVEPFCKTFIKMCNPLFRHLDEVRDNCSPVYYNTQSLYSGCSVFSRCQNANDTVIAHESDSSEQSKSGTNGDPADSDMTCNFGNLTMNLGDELNQATDYSSVCVKCVCDVPPVLSCQRLPDEECDVTKHPPFHDHYG